MVGVWREGAVEEEEGVVESLEDAVEGFEGEVDGADNVVMGESVLEAMAEEVVEAEDDGVEGETLDAVLVEINVLDEVLVDTVGDGDMMVETSVDSESCVEDDIVGIIEEDMLVDKIEGEAAVLEEAMLEVDMTDEAIEARLDDPVVEPMDEDGNDTVGDTALKDIINVEATLLLDEATPEAEATDEAVEAVLLKAVVEPTTEDEDGVVDNATEDNGLEGEIEFEAEPLDEAMPEGEKKDEAVEATPLEVIAELRMDDANDTVGDEVTELEEAKDDAPVEDDTAEDGIVIADPIDIAEEAEPAAVEEIGDMVDAAEDETDAVS